MDRLYMFAVGVLGCFLFGYFRARYQGHDGRESVIRGGEWAFFWLVVGGVFWVVSSIPSLLGV